MVSISCGMIGLPLALRTPVSPPHRVALVIRSSQLEALIYTSCCLPTVNRELNCPGYGEDEPKEYRSLSHLLTKTVTLCLTSDSAVVPYFLEGDTAPSCEAKQ